MLNVIDCLPMPFISQYMETAMLFVKRDVTKKSREFFFSLFVLLDLLFTASNLIFDLGLNI